MGSEMCIRDSIRPNLNKRPETTVHRGTLGTKLDSVLTLSIECIGTVIRESGVKLLTQKKQKTVHAGLLGYRLTEVVDLKATSKKVTYSPATKSFLVDGEELVTPCTITAIDGVYYVI